MRVWAASKGVIKEEIELKLHYACRHNGNPNDLS